MIPNEQNFIPGKAPPHWQVKRWIHHRAHSETLSTEHANRQRSLSIWLLSTTLIRVLAWTVLIACVGAGMAHIGGFSWAKDIAASIPFVALISLYANWATDLGASIAAYAALVASDVHSQVTTTESDIETSADSIETDIALLSDLHPGPEAHALAIKIRSRLAGNGQAS